jgi:bifunctional non-homologous end joining protein LigD
VASSVIAARLLTRTGLDWTAKFRPIATALASLPAKSAYLEGEIAVPDADGVSSSRSPALHHQVD